MNFRNLNSYLCVKKILIFSGMNLGGRPKDLARDFRAGARK